MLHKGENVLSARLISSLYSRFHLLDDAIKEAVDRVDVIVTRPVLINSLRRIDKHPHDLSSIDTLNAGMRSFRKTGFIELTVQNKNKVTLVRAGDIQINPKISMPVRAYRNVRLAWNGVYYLIIYQPFKSQGKIVGYLSAAMQLPKMDYVLSNINSLGPSAELAICGKQKSDKLFCFPTRLNPNPAFDQPMQIHGHPLPMALALEGKSGLVTSHDYRDHQVIAAYMPIAQTGLGMVLKVDASDLYASIWHTLPYIIPALVFMVILGTLLLHWLIAPLVRYLIASEVETRESQRLLEDRDARLRILFDTVDEGIIVVNAEGVIEEFNPGAEEIFGYARPEVIGRNVNLLMNETDRSRHDSYIAHYRETGTSSLIGKGRELAGIKKDGTLVMLDLRLNEVNLGNEQNFVATMRDITERKKQELRIQYLATHDALTDLPNRNHFLDLVTQSLNQAKRHGHKIAVMFLDLDRFKQVNDECGHDVGDMLLIEFSRRVRNVLREEDMVARQGGDEFIVALPQIGNFKSVKLVADRIYETTRKPFMIGGRKLDVGVSIGIAMFPEDGDNVETLIKYADASMYKVKVQRQGQR